MYARKQLNNFRGAFSHGSYAGIWSARPREYEGPSSCVSQSNRCCVCAQWMLWRGRFLLTRVHYTFLCEWPVAYTPGNGSLTPQLSENKNNNEVKWMRVSFPFAAQTHTHTLAWPFHSTINCDTFECVTMQHFNFIAILRIAPNGRCSWVIYKINQLMNAQRFITITTSRATRAGSLKRNGEKKQIRTHVILFGISENKN